MREVEMYLNSHHMVKSAILYVGPDYQSCCLKDFINTTNLDEIIITGDITQKQGLDILSPLIEQDSINKQRLPSKLQFISLEEIIPTEKEVDALVFENVEDISVLFQLEKFSPKYLVGEMKQQGLSSFALWEKYRNTCEEILIVTKRIDMDAQVLSWKKNTDNNIELSVIFPMYNVAKYLDQCIESVTAWKADYIEFLFVNDGSPDNSKEIVLEWAKKDRRIKLLDKPNGGCASARQWGLDRAKGRYVGFIDPDDYIDESMFRKLLRAAMIGSYEISYCGYNELYENTGETKKVDDLLGWPYNLGIVEPNKIWPMIAFSRVAIWRGIYKTDFLNRSKIHFYTDLRRFDDLPFKVETLANAKSIIAVNEHLYYYRLARPGQDVSADDDRLYVHFPIFNYLNESVASTKDQRIIDYLQLCKIQTHRYAINKIRKEFLKEYVLNAKKDLMTTGNFFRTLFMAKKELGKKARMYYFGMVTNNIMLLNFLKHND
ncbi:MAG: glycosyltransferase [Oscillospiraceae bacterium]|nr:glycosyltransferase [Oscillospiraceae bacterium]